MEKQFDIVIVGIQPWDIAIGSNCKNMALEFAKNNRVLYVNAPLDRFSLWKNRKEAGVQKRKRILRGLDAPLEAVSSNLWVFNPPVLLESIQFLPDFLFRIANKRNNKIFAKAIRNAIRELGFEHLMLFNDSDMFRSFHLKEYLEPEKYVYYTRDQLMTVPYWKKHGQKFEPELMKKADLVVGNSPHLVAYAKQFTQQAFFIGQGCDLTLFQAAKSYEKPSDLNKIPGKIIGYTGLLSSRRLDPDLIYFLALSKPNWSFVLVGPEESSFSTSILHDLSNVYFLGNKNPNELPAYIAHFDLCFNPQCVNELTEANYPRKIDEYLAMGKAVVARDTPTMSLFKDQVYLAASHQAFLDCLEQALQEKTEEQRTKRIELANSHSWENCIRSFWAAFEYKPSF